MIYLILSILLSVLLLLNFRIFPRFRVNILQAIALNYPVCFLTGFLLMPEGQSFFLDFSQTWTWLALAMGVGFIITFLLSGLSTQRMGITATSLANNMSLVVPVCVSLWVLKTGQNFDGFNYLGLVLALLAVGLSTFKKEEGNERKSILNLNVLLPITVFLMYGLTNTLINYVNFKYITDPNLTVRVTLTMVLGAVISGVILLIFRVLFKKEKIEKQTLVAAFTLGIPNYLSFYMLFKALSAYGNNGALVYPLYNIGVILVAALAATLIFKEKLLMVNKIGLVLAVLAIVLISYQAFV